MMYEESLARINIISKGNVFEAINRASGLKDEDERNKSKRREKLFVRGEDWNAILIIKLRENDR